VAVAAADHEDIAERAAPAGANAAGDPDDPDDPALAPTTPAASGPRPAVRRALPPWLLARYEGLTLVGEGGMGIVYRGHDPRLGRAVAIKLIKGDDPARWRRFIQEARAQARVQHDNVCRVYEAGQADGEPYVVMQLIDGEPLARLRDRLSLEQRVRLMRDVAAAVHEAHRLGLVHRDLKPQNVLVELPEDGPPKPYVVDFGLAREVAERGDTSTGAVVGTPAYMPPEQALGDVRAIDRRSDVYALGATLYDLVAGRPPFVDEHPWKLLLQVVSAEPPPLGRVQAGVPADLETIVMKCLERAPGRRYESARALAEDLGRFLDGDPIVAKRASPLYVAWKKAQKHRLATALGAAAVIASLSLGAVWAKGRRDAAEQARLAQTLGEDVKGMELFLRNAYALPRHDVERERDVVRRRLSLIEAKMKAAGRVGEGPGHYALGRGNLALGDPAAARRHLEAARAAGYASAALDGALGEALGELYRRAVEEARRISNDEERKKRIAALAAELRDPAIARLRAAAGAGAESPAYAEGLIALFEGRHEEALAKARQAFAEAPWLYEAKKLEGDVLYALGSPFRHDGVFDYERMMSHFRPAAEAYRAAADMARSDPEVHRAECELWEKIGYAEAARGASADAAFDTAEAACARAVEASHAAGRARTQAALVLSARMSTVFDPPLAEARRLADLAVRAAEEAVRAQPDDVMAEYALARAHMEAFRLLYDLDPSVTPERSIAAYQRAAAMDPQFTWVFSELGDVYLSAAYADRMYGRDSLPALERAVRAYAHASRLDPAFTLPVEKTPLAYMDRLEFELERGQVSDATLSAFADATAAMDRHIGQGRWITVLEKARVLRYRGLHALVRGRDPRAALEDCVRTIRAFTAEPRDDHLLLIEESACHRLLAAHAMRTGASPRASLDEARRALRAAAKASDPDSWWREHALEVDLLEIRDAVRRGDARAELFDAASAHIQPDLSRGSIDPRLLQLAAEVHARRAAWLAKSRKDPGEDLRAGRALLARVVAMNPRLPRGLATAGLFALAEARWARARADREDAARRGREAFAAAFRENPLLAPDFTDEVKELSSLAP